MRVVKSKEVRDRTSLAEASALLDPETATAPLSAPRSALRREAVLPSAVIGELIAIVGTERTPLIRYPGQAGTAAIRARTTVELGARDIGKTVALVFESGDSRHPLVIGVLRGDDPWPVADAPMQVEVDADGSRMQISAKCELVLKCGKASITLTQAGGISVRGTTVLTEASGLNRIRGASVELN